MCEEVPLEAFWKDAEKPLTRTRWVDAIQTSGSETLIRGRVVARHCTERGDKRADLCGATPPLDTLNSLLALLFKEALKVMAIEVKTAKKTGKTNRSNTYNGIVFALHRGYGGNGHGHNSGNANDDCVLLVMMMGTISIITLVL